ncbi:MAG: DNA polymerase III subunit epsilon [Magnetococcales bacterium]|nr:DNA polymerase III subunit epsilon [Magnetococcales bacterium]
MKRLIVLDTETTGLNPGDGHRIVEIGCVELINMRPRETRQWYINPERSIPNEAAAIHGITNDQVANAPTFAQMVTEWLDFIGEDTLVIHNASFDIGFLNAELSRCQRPPLSLERTIDTVALGRRRFPGSSVSLDALCKRFNIDYSNRQLHGALTDAKLLAEVYVELTGGNQFRLQLSQESERATNSSGQDYGGGIVAPPATNMGRWPVRQWSLPAVDLTAHQSFLELLQKESSDCIWLRASREKA